MIIKILRSCIFICLFHLQLFSFDIQWAPCQLENSEEGTNPYEYCLFEFELQPETSQRTPSKPKSRQKKSSSLPEIAESSRLTALQGAIAKKNTKRTSSQPTIALKPKITIDILEPIVFLECASIVHSPKRNIYIQSNFQGHFRNVNFEHDQFSRSNLQNLLTGGKLIRSEFTQCTFTNCVFILCNIGAAFNQCGFVNCVFIDSDFENCRFNGCNFSDVLARCCANSDKYTYGKGRVSIFPSNGSVKVTYPMKECSSWRSEYDEPNIVITPQMLRLP